MYVQMSSGLAQIYFGSYLPMGSYQHLSMYVFKGIYTLMSGLNGCNVQSHKFHANEKVCRTCFGRVATIFNFK